MKKRRILYFAVPALALALALLAGLLYLTRYYRAGGEALAALASDAVTVEETELGWLFDGPAEDAALIFYPGAKVEETAYAPLLHRLAQSGPDVFLVRMPFHIALFGRDRAEGVMNSRHYADWYIGGHSLGGVMAAEYAAEHALRGVVLLAAYPISPLEEPVLLIYGERDGVLDRDRVREASRYGAVREVVIPGGNHALFGCYGPQKGDAVPEIDAAQQQAQTVEAITAWMAR